MPERQSRPLVTIDRATASDVPIVQSMFEDAIAFQAASGFPQWQNVSAAVIEEDIRKGNQYTLSVSGTAAGVFSLCPASLLDHELWAGREPDTACYMNRIIVSQAFRGHGLFKQMLEWSEVEVRRRGAALLRMDTWADNPRLIELYQSHGFALLGAVTTSEQPDLPAQYRGLRLSLLEKRLR